MIKQIIDWIIKTEYSNKDQISEDLAAVAGARV